MDGAGEILRERIRQIHKEGWTADHDDQWSDGEMIRAAIFYALPREQRYPVDDLIYWPWAVEWYKPKDRIRDLVRAGALIAAEIDRLKRKENMT